MLASLPVVSVSGIDTGLLTAVVTVDTLLVDCVWVAEVNAAENALFCAAGVEETVAVGDDAVDEIVLAEEEDE